MWVGGWVGVGGLAWRGVGMRGRLVAEGRPVRCCMGQMGTREGGWLPCPARHCPAVLQASPSCCPLLRAGQHQASMQQLLLLLLP
jgi:hypothetical protein